MEKDYNLGKTISLVTDQNSLSKVCIWIKGENEVSTPISINWGDGSFTTSLSDTSHLFIEHNYAIPDVYKILITGDIDNFVGFGSNNSNITDVDISNLTNLEGVDFFKNKISQLNLSNNIKLKYLSCANNLLTTLDLSTNSELSRIVLNNNQLQFIDLQNKLKLFDLYINNNHLNSIDLTGNIELFEVDISSNQINTLNLENSNLVRLFCSNNLLDSLNITNCFKLEMLICSNNRLKGIDLSLNTQLKEIRCEDNQISTLDLKTNGEIRGIGLQGTNLTQQGFNDILSTVLSFKRYSTPIDRCYIYTNQRPSGQGITDMIRLRSIYNWFVLTSN